MNVRDLIAYLSDMDPEAEVHFAYDYGDRSHTRVAPTVRKVTEGYVMHSGYHNMDTVFEAECEDDTRSENASEVVLLS